MVEEIAPGQYSEESNAFSILFENSYYWVQQAKHFLKELNNMNKHNKNYNRDYIKLVNDLSRLGGEKYE